MEPQPLESSIIKVYRYYSNLKKDKLYRRRVTWMQYGHMDKNIACEEYLGVFPGLKPHGNAKVVIEEYER